MVFDVGRSFGQASVSVLTETLNCVFGRPLLARQFCAISCTLGFISFHFEPEKQISETIRLWGHIRFLSTSQSGPQILQLGQSHFGFCSYTPNEIISARIIRSVHASLARALHHFAFQTTKKSTKVKKNHCLQTDQRRIEKTLAKPQHFDLIALVLSFQVSRDILSQFSIGHWSFFDPTPIILARKSMKQKLILSLS